MTGVLYHKGLYEVYVEGEFLGAFESQADAYVVFHGYLKKPD